MSLVYNTDGSRGVGANENELVNGSFYGFSVRSVVAGCAARTTYGGDRKTAVTAGDCTSFRIRTTSRLTAKYVTYASDIANVCRDTGVDYVAAGRTTA